MIVPIFPAARFSPSDPAQTATIRITKPGLANAVSSLLTLSHPPNRFRYPFRVSPAHFSAPLPLGAVPPAAGDGADVVGVPPRRDHGRHVLHLHRLVPAWGPGPRGPSRGYPSGKARIPFTPPPHFVGIQVTLQHQQIRSAVYGRGDWLGTVPPPLPGGWMPRGPTEDAVAGE